MTIEERTAMKESIDRLSAIVEKIDMRSRRIETLLKGDTAYRITGLVERVENCEKKSKGYEMDRAKIIGGAAVGAAIAGWLSTNWHKLFG